METESVSETSDFTHPMRLSARENFTEIRLC
jgi:hypothetical protein